MRNSLTANILLKAKQFGIFSVFALTATLASFPLAVKAQIAVDGSTATEVKGNVISPTGSGTTNGGNLYNSFDRLNVPSTGVIFNTGSSSVDGTKVNNIINRVTGDTPSNILGAIESRQAFPNANLYLLNPNGVVFGTNARLDVGGSFYATTGTGLSFDQDKKFNVDKNSLSFPSGDPKNIQFAIAQPAAIINQGNLSVDAGKNISLTAGTVINTGNLTAPSGNVNLAAVSGNSQVELRSPDLVLGFAVNKNVIPTTWNGEIATLPKLAESLTGKISQADQVVVKPDGTIALVTNLSSSDIAVKEGMAIASGQIDVSSSTSQGGNVGIFGNQVGLVNSQINASGTTGGGTVLVGGDLQGKGTVPNSLQTYVDSSSTILANGLLNGNGGKVIFWADDFTRFLGKIEAKGGINSGDGGFVEVSGKQNLDFQGRVNTLAPNGATGSLLLDPTDITIGGTFDSGGGFTSGVFTPSAASANIQASTLVGQLGTNNVTISTASAFSAPLGGTITVNNPLNWSSNNSLTLQANNNIIVNGNITANGSGNFTATAANNITVNASQLTTNAGALILTATNGNIDIPATTALGSFTTGSINFTAGNGIALGGTVLSTSGGNITLRAGNGGIGVTTTNGINSTFPSGNSGFILIDTTGFLAVTNGITSESLLGNGGNITIGSTLPPTTINVSSIRADGSVNGGNISLNGNLALTASTALSTTGTTNGGNINLASANVTGNQSLTLNAGNGNVSLGAIGTNSIPLTDLNITSGNTVLNKDVFVGNALSFNSPVTLGGNASVTTSSGDIFFNNTVNGNQSLTLNAGNNSIHFNDIVGGITPLASLSISTASTLTSLGNLDITALGNISTGAIATFGLLQPITITTAGSFNVNGKDINTASSDLTLTANQGFAALGNISTSGGNVAIASNLGNVASNANTTIDASSTDASGGNISITANNGILSLQNLNTSSSAGSAIGNGGDIILRSGSDISIANINTSGTSFNDGNAGTVSIFQTSGNITLTGSNILLNALKGSPGLNGTGSSISFPSNVIISSPSLNINTIGFTGNGSVTFLTGLISSNSNLSISTGTGNINFFGVAGTSTQPLGNIIANSSGITRFNSTVNAASLTTDAVGITQLNSNVNSTGAQIYNDAVNLTNAVQLEATNSAIAFNNTVNGAFNLSLNANNNSIIANSTFGDVTPLASLAIAPSSTLTSNVFNPISISTTGNISTGKISNPITSISLTSKTGAITTGDINTSGNIGGQVFFNAATAINAGRINTTGITKAGDVTLDPSGDVIVQSIDASSPVQGGNVTLVSTGGNLIITDRILGSSNLSCLSASICTAGGTGGNISLQTGGLNPFVVGDALTNGSSGILTTGLTTLSLGTSIPALLGSSFTQGGISVTPGGFLTTVTTRPTTTFEPPKKSDDILIENPDDAVLLAVRDIFKKDADRYLNDNNLAKAFEAIERAYVAEIEIFTGNSSATSAITIENTQDLLSTVAQQTGDVAALIYPILLDNRIEILVVPPKEKGKPFRRFTIASNQKAVEELVTDYRNNLRDVGSNDYLEQSQKLYDLIIRPIDQQLTAMKINTLVFVMDSGLRVTPPAAFHDGKQFLIERYAIANIPTMRATRLEERDRKATRILAMGLTESVEGFSALPSVDIEIKTISSEILKGASFLNKEFTISNLQNQRQQGKYSILHLGTHAKFISDTSQESFIQFWNSQLKLSQIPQLRFDSPVIDMLTLSACETAVGNNLGISGLAVESGARSVLASLWAVSDVGTAPLMISFYKAFPDAINKAHAIQQAQINLLKSKVSIRNNQIVGIEGFPNIPLPSSSDNIDLSHPFYWSSFILVGNWL